MAGRLEAINSNGSVFITLAYDAAHQGSLPSFAGVFGYSHS